MKNIKATNSLDGDRIGTITALVIKQEKPYIATES